MADLFLRRYGEATTILFDLYDPTDGQGEEAAAHAAGDSVISKDEAAEANTASGFAQEGGSCYSLALSAAEMTCARAYIRIVDQTATKVWLDKLIIIETYGNASAQHNNGAFGVSPSTG